MKTKLTMTGDRELKRLFKSLPLKVQKKALRPAVNVATTPVLKLARGKAPRESGLLAKSMGKKIKVYKSGVVVGIVGARRGIEGEYKGKRRVPANYAHLAEKKHKFLESAESSARSQSIKIMKDKLAETTVKEALRLGKR